MGRPGAKAASVAVLATLLVSGCGVAELLSADVQQKDDPTPDNLPTGRDVPSTEEPPAPTEEEDDSDSQRVDSEHGWDGGAIETTTESGVTFAVPADWERFSEAEVDTGQEAVYLWQEPDAVYIHAESSVFNMGTGEPEAGVTAYLDVLAELGQNDQDPDLDAPEEFDVPGADDAVRVDYAFSQPGFESTAIGSVIGFTATTGELLVFTVAADGDNAVSELNEEIISTLLVGAPPGGGV
ncbi:hypothetical protein J4H86_23565 [Spiractinospora alimapuensis]|uniref:hypothetical protein n=1 Tax=Spiractinospora alimapuensis TaxID=2820884 RepID=UPI001F3BF8D8|nr:hypothetical protein [Spiractinospora alimapuensis]QVQ51714.1 hypothetical protein J4H86_23565 [Spiractinospora alimapuensis]